MQQKYGRHHQCAGSPGVPQLYRTGNALPYVLSQIWWVHDMPLAERVAHRRLADHRISPRREFFEIAPQHRCWEWEYKSEELTSSPG